MGVPWSRRRDAPPGFRAAARAVFAVTTIRLQSLEGYDNAVPQPAGAPLRLQPQSAYVAPSLKNRGSSQRSIFRLTYCPTKPSAPLHVWTKGLTADIFYWSEGYGMR